MFLTSNQQTGYKTRFHQRPKDAHEKWWTPERDAKLRYVMEKYDDPAKAARVLGIGVRSARWRWGTIKDQDATNPADGDAG